jgi:hypothetical protein
MALNDTGLPRLRSLRRSEARTQELGCHQVPQAYERERYAPGSEIFSWRSLKFRFVFASRRAPHGHYCHADTALSAACGLPEGF